MRFTVSMRGVGVESAWLTVDGHRIARAETLLVDGLWQHREPVQEIVRVVVRQTVRGDQQRGRRGARQVPALRDLTDREPGQLRAGGGDKLDAPPSRGRV
jgi:hypothetical protein